MEKTNQTSVISLNYLLRLLFILILPVHLPAAVYKWKDEHGNVHYGDNPPGKQAEKITVEEKPVVDEDLELRREKQKKMLWILEQERMEKKQQTEMQRKKKREKKEQCDRAQDYLKSITSAGRIYDLDADGNRIYQSDDERDKHIQELKQSIADNCNSQ